MVRAKLEGIVMILQSSNGLLPSGMLSFFSFKRDSP